MSSAGGSLCSDSRVESIDLSLMNEQPAAEPFSLYPSVIVVAAFALGIILENWLDPTVLPLMVVIVASSLVVFLFRRTPLSTPLIILTFIALGSLCLSFEHRSIRQDRIRVLLDGDVIQNNDPVDIEEIVFAPPRNVLRGAEILRNRCWRDLDE